MNTESIDKYNSFNFLANLDWQNYLKNIFPTPSYDKLEKIKRKWYKQFIDPSFDINYSDQQNQQQQQQQQPHQNQQPSNNNNQQQNQPRPPQQQPRQDVSYLYILENLAKTIFFPMSIVASFPAKILILVSCLLGIYRNKKPIQFNTNYLGQIVQTEFLQNIIYLIGISMPQKESFVLFLPIWIHFFSGIAEYMVSSQHGLYMKIAPVKKLLDYIKLNRQFVIITKQKSEIWILIYVVIGVFVGYSSFFQIILMVQYIGIKNKFNRNMKQAWWEIQGNLNVIASQSPGIIRTLILKLIWGFNKILNFM